MKISSNYKMSKTTKRMLMVTPIEKLASMKKIFIDAELAEIRARNSKIKDNTKIDTEA